MTIVLLQTALFPDAHTVEAALAPVCGPEPRCFDLRRAEMGEADWDEVLDAVLSADQVITL